MGLAVLTVAILLLAEVRRRQGLYWYEVTNDYQFEFAQGQHTRLTVEVSSEGFVLPETQGTWDTAFLAIRVSTTLSGHWFEPSIGVAVGERSKQRQFFERGVRGVRYLNLLPDTGVPGEPVYLEGHHMKWRKQTAELLLFRQAGVSNGKTLVLAPHPDDAEIAAFGLYADRDSYVATITAGDYVDGVYRHIFEDPVAQDLLKGKLRTWDSLVVPLWGGVPAERTVNLGYHNGTLRELRRPDGVSPDSSTPGGGALGLYRSGNVDELLEGRQGDASWASLVQDLEALLTSVRPEVVAAPHPVLDVSSDHRLTTVALLEALERLGDEDTVLLLYNNHHVWTEYFPFGPSDALVTLPPWFDTEAPFASVYSHPLDKGRQVEKLFALDAMHDLRAGPRVVAGGPAGRFVRRLGALFSGLRSDPLSTYSYFRRAVRPNELFFVYLPEDRAGLAEYAARDVGGPVGLQTR